jgi:hypothetical protein
VSTDDFTKADAEVQVLPPERRDIMVAQPISDVIKFRTELVKGHYNGSSSLASKLKDDGKEDVESLLVAMLDEIIGESDNLLGNGLVATHNGDLRDASVISFKRAEILEKAIKAVQAKQQIEKQSGIDVDSPAVFIIFRFFMAKARDAFVHMGVGNEINDLFFRTFGDVTQDWKKELKQQFEAMRSSK